MNNVKTAIRRFFTNKNTVTIIGVLLGIVILYVGYNYRINSQINPTSVPVSYTHLDVYKRQTINYGFFNIDTRSKTCH